jgi:hypothetical protein
MHDFNVVIRLGRLIIFLSTKYHKGSYKFYTIAVNQQSYFLNAIEKRTLSQVA